MDFNILLNALGVSEGTLKNKQLQIASDTLTPNIGDLIDYCYANQPITVNSASVKEIDNENSTITISGTSDFLNVPKLAVEIHFSIDEHADVQLVLRYQVLGDTAGVNDWKFSKSFPEMPKVVDETQDYFFDRQKGTITYPEKYPLDDYYFYNAYFVVVSSPQIDTSSQKPLKWGINFVSKMRPEGALGIAKNVFGFNLEIDVYGTIRVPRQEDNPEQLLTHYKGSQKQFQFPWTIADDFTYGLPGILLQVDLGVHFTPIKDKLDLRAEKFYIYSPTNLKWNIADANPQLLFSKAYTGKIALPEANIEVDILIPDTEGYSSTIVIAHFEGVSVANIAHLSGITGGDSPLEHLPSQIKEIGHELGKLTLENASFEIDYDDITDVKISYFNFTMGMPDLNWVVWKDHFEIQTISVEFDVANPMATKKSIAAEEAAGITPNERTISVKMRGTMELEQVPFNVFATKEGDFEVFAEIEGNQTLPLKSLVQKYFKGLTPPGDLTIDTLRFGAKGSHEYSFAMAMADKPNSWVIPIGGRKFEAYDVYMSAAYDQTDGTSGTIGGTIAFDDIATLYLQYTSPGNITIKSYLEEISIKKLLKTLGADQLPVPKAFDLDLKNNTLLLEEASDSYTFQLATEVSDFGTLALQLQKNGAQTGAAFGLNMTTGHPFNLPGLSELKAFSNMLTLENFLIVVSSFDAPAFQFPGLANFGNPMLSSTSIPMPKGSTGVIKGLNIHALWTLDDEDKALSLLRKILGLDPSLDVTLQVSENPTENSRLYLKYDTKIEKHHELSCQFGFAMIGGDPELFLEGILHTKIQKHTCIFDIAMSLLANGIYFAGSMEGTIGFEGIQLSNLAFALGFDWECIPSIGIAATIDTKDFDSSIAVLFDSIDPQKSLMAGSISDISLADIVEMFVHAEEKALGIDTEVSLPSGIEHILNAISLSGTHPFKMPLDLVESLNHMDLEKVSAAFLQHGNTTIPSSQSSVLLVINEPGKRWSLTDKVNNMRHYEITADKKEITVAQNAQIYICPERSQMGDMVFQEGFFLTGGLTIFGLSWESQIEINKSKGIAAESAINKALVIYKADFFKLSDFSGKTGPSFSFSTYTRPEIKDEDLRSPHFCLSGQLRTLGMDHKALVMATKNGMSFEIDSTETLSLPEKILSGSINMDFNLHGAFDSITNFDAGATMDIHLKGSLHLGKIKLFNKINVDFGTIELDLDVSGSIDMGYDGKEVFIKFKGDFEFMSSEHHFNLELDLKSANIKKAGEWVLDELKDILEKAYKTAEEWMEDIGKGFVTIAKGAEQAAHVLKEGFEKADKEAMHLLHEAGHNFEEIGSALKNIYGTAEKDFGNMMHDAGAEVEQISDALKNTFKSGAKEVAGFIDGLENTSPEDVANAMKHTFKQTGKQFTKTMKELGKDGEAIAHGLQKGFKQTAKQTTALLNTMGVPTDEIGKALKNIYKQSAQNAATLLKGIGKDGEAIGHALSVGFKNTATQTARALDAIGIHPHDISKALKNVYKQSAKDMAQTLKNIGKAGKQIGSCLKNVYKHSAHDCAKIMEGVKEGLSSIGAVFKDVYKLDGNNAAKTFKSLKKDGQAIAGVLKDTFKLPSKDMAKALDLAGISTDEIGKAMKNVYKLPAEEVANTFKGMGKDSKVVAKTLKNAFKMSTKDTGNLLKKTFDLNKGALSDALKGAGYASKEVDKFASSAFKSVKKTAKKVGKSLKHAFHL